MTMPREQSTQLPERRILLERAAMVWACAQGGNLRDPVAVLHGRAVALRGGTSYWPEPAI